MHRYMLSYSPRYYKLAKRRESRYAPLTTVLAIMVAHSAALATVLTLLVTLALLLLAMLIARSGLVALYWNWKVLLAPWL